MSEFPRRIVSRLRRYLGDRRRHKRVEVKLPIALTLSTPHISTSPSGIPTSNGYTITGSTIDLSETGVALNVKMIRVGEHYFAGTDQTLHLRIDLPDGLVDLSVVPVRYENLTEDARGGYLIGARIVGMNSDHKPRYEAFLAGLLEP